MQINRLRIHNFRSIIDVELVIQGYVLLVGANNAGKSNVINAIRTFYDDIKWSDNDFPKIGAKDDEAWIELSYALNDEEWSSLADNYKSAGDGHLLILKRHFRGKKAKAGQSNIYAIVDGREDNELFYGAKNVGAGKIGNIIYIPAITTPNDQMKTSGPSPLRNMLNFVLKNIVQGSTAYSAIESAFMEFNREAKQGNGFLSEITKPINEALSDWNIDLDLSVNQISTDDITKNLVKPSFIDKSLGDCYFELERFGHGYQRTVMYELIKLAPSFTSDKKKIEKKEFSPDYNLILFEEPEAFLHPTQQEVMSYNLRRLSESNDQQVIVTTHSQVFVGKNSDQLTQIVRLMKINGASTIFQLSLDDLNDLYKDGLDLIACLEKYVNSSEANEDQIKEARKLIGEVPTDEVADQRERFKYQIWLDSEKSAMFFADKVLLVEGATERALINYLIAYQWHEFNEQKVFVVDALGKYNFHRFMRLFEKFGIPHGVLLDDDHDKGHHQVVNNLIRSRRNQSTLSNPVFISGCIEEMLKLHIPNRTDLKPIEVLRAIEEKKVDETVLLHFKGFVCQALGMI